MKIRRSPGKKINTCKKYEVIYADPGWSYRDKANAGNRGACHKYLTSSNDYIASLPIDKISAENSTLFLWITMPKLSEVFEVISQWGFTYKTCAFTWVKRNKLADTWFWGLGNWTRANSELCLLATKGSPKRVSKAVHSVIDTPIEEHSKKPDIVREKIVTLMGDVPRIELFARERADGWDALGVDIDGKDIKESLNEKINGYVI